MPQQNPEQSQSVRVSTLPALTAKGIWRLEGLRARHSHAFYWITRGQAKITLAGANHGTGASSLLFVPAGHIHRLVLRKYTQGYVAFVPETLPVPVGSKPSLIKATNIFEQGQITGFYEQMSAERNAQSVGFDQAMEAYATLLSVWIERASDRNEWEKKGRASRSSQLVDRFLILLEGDLRLNLSVEDYARMMKITPAHLSRVCQEHLNLPSSGVIQARLLLEARYLLCDSDLRVGKISSELGFSTPGYFSRFFARHAGISPRGFRANAQRPPRR